jgi:hypothetical protein
MSQEQMQDIQKWLQLQQQDPPIFVSSVPVLLPPLIGMLQYLTGERLWHKQIWPLSWLGKQLARFQLFVAHKASFDHWPLYASTWHEFIQLAREKQQEIIILAGDVHFSYALEGRLAPTDKPGAHLYQFVSTPLQNVLGTTSERKVKLQASITRIAYSGLRLRMLPLKSAGTKARIYKQLLFEDTLAFVTLYPGSHDTNQIKHEYMSCVEGELKVVGVTKLPAKA